jgi:hypothetical protein
MLDRATKERDGAAGRLSIWGANDQERLKTHIAPLEAAARIGRQKLVIAKRVREIVRRDPTLLRYGVLAVCHLGARIVATELAKAPWDGKVNMWGIPIEPPTHRIV